MEPHDALHTPIPPVYTDTPRKPPAAAPPEPVQIAIPDPSITSDTALMARLTELVNAVYTAAEEGLFSPAYQRTSADELRQLIRARELALAWRSDITAPTSQTPSAIPASALVGCVRITSLSPTHGDFGMLVCDPTFRGSGTGRDLVKFAEEASRAAGKTVMQCELLVSVDFSHPFKTRMQGWYERMGYQVVKNGDFGADYPHIAPHLITKTEYRVFEKALVTV
ncbi:hypothetical protein B0T25DRAFT_521020 [Lasiosphaeria hispida]|uniref:N-acetyltransferase domain-containing protein n=1 Tax=Lasiosphaeria hispida TaxID=260671 RepID=A0AAJ0HBQ5_9PEZI|nr:hypothetical protein B0T25DRAFT_521020 [Lasiosphaeria hispida]